MDKTEKWICFNSSVLIGLLMSSPKFLALRENGFIAHYWHFNLGELIFQVILNIIFCYLIFTINIRQHKSSGNILILNFFFSTILMVVLCLAGGIFQRHFFVNKQVRGIFWTGYFTRFLLSALFAAIIIKIVFLLREGKQKDNENNQLKTAYLEAELKLLKEQLNPHFLFNSLSSLSGIIRENPEKGQHFISHLSKVFRYALAHPNDHLVPLSQELVMIKSYEQLLKMRFEEAFILETDIPEKYMDNAIPHLSLQPLLENAAKHNSASLRKPLIVKIYIDSDYLIVENNLQQIPEPENSTGIGLPNLNCRFRILMQNEIEIQRNADNFTVKLPLNK